MKTSVFLLLSLFTIAGNAQQPEPATIKELERKFDQAVRRLDQLNEAVQSLRAEIAKLKGARAVNQDVQSPATATLHKAQAEIARLEFAERVIGPEMGASEREEALQAKPEIFIQSRYAALPIRDSNGEFEPNLSMTRIETRWAGRLSERISAGLEIQFHPALDGSAEELVNDENLIGMDFQYVIGRLGLRGEIVAGDTPSTLLGGLGNGPEFADAFRPGARSAGGALFATWRLTGRDHVYARYDQFNRDPVKGYNVRAFNFGYLRYLGAMTRIGFDYQFKNRPSFNDDALNGRFHIIWSVEF